MNLHPERIRRLLKFARRLFVVGAVSVVIIMMIGMVRVIAGRHTGGASYGSGSSEFFASVTSDFVSYGANEFPWRFTVDLDLYLSGTVRWQGFTPVEYDERRYEVLSIPAPFTLGLSDSTTNEYVELTIDPDHPITHWTGLVWNDTGTAIRIPNQEQYGWVVFGEQYIWGNFWKGLGWEISWRLIPVLVTLFALSLTHERIWIRPRPWLCDRCGYDLRGSDTGACPECGKGYSPDAYAD